MIVDHALLQGVWASLNAPSRTASPYAGRELLRRIALDGRMLGYQLEDLAYAFDPRVVGLHGFDLEVLAEALGYRWQIFFPRPKARSIEQWGNAGLTASDAAALLMQLESLGFAFDGSELIDALRPAISKKPNLTASELAVFLASKKRFKSNIVLQVDDRSLGFGGIRHGRFANGYRYEIWLADDGSITSLDVKSPKYRETREPVETRCDQCGYQWMRGDPESSALHRKEHRLRMFALDPQPNQALLDARRAENDPDFVDSDSPVWKHAEMFRRAWAFKREMHFDFAQWESPDSTKDPDAQGILLSDVEGRILGAVAFRFRQVLDQSESGIWCLDWVWICPSARRKGLLSARWPEFRERFGAFYVEGPVSDAMQAFLRKYGEEILMTWPSRRAAKMATT